MSITTRLATAAFAAAIASLAISSALANTKGPSGPPSRPSMGGAPAQAPGPHYYGPHHYYTGGTKFTVDCYYLPTVSNGSVSGLEKHCWAHYK